MLTTAILLVLIVGLMYQVYRLTVRLNDIEEVAEHAHTRTDTQQNKHEYLTGAMDTLQKETKHLKSDVKVHKDALEAAIEILPVHKAKIRELENIIASVILPHIEEWFGKRSDGPIAIKTIKKVDEFLKWHEETGSLFRIACPDAKVPRDEPSTGNKSPEGDLGKPGSPKTPDDTPNKDTHIDPEDPLDMRPPRPPVSSSS